MPNARLYRPGGGGTPGITLLDQGVSLGTIQSLNVQGADLAAFIFGSQGTIESPPVRFGYFSGGQDGAALLLSTSAIDFGNDVAAQVAKGNLNTAVANCAGVCSAIAGYVGGGFDTFGSPTTSPTNLVQKLLFASDTVAMTLVAALTLARSQISGFNSSSRGYFSGGLNGPVGLPTSYQTLTDSIDFTNDGAALVVKGSLTVGRWRAAGANSQTVGYVSGGGSENSVNPALSSTDGLTFANDTSAMVAKGVLTTGRAGLASANSNTKAYFSGGSPQMSGGGAAMSSTDALTFATDGVAMVARGALTIARTNFAGCNSRTFGYFAGGGAFLASCDGLEFANDAAAMVAKGALTAGRNGAASFQSGGIL